MLLTTCTTELTVFVLLINIPTMLMQSVMNEELLLLVFPIIANNGEVMVLSKHIKYDSRIFGSAIFATHDLAVLEQPGRRESIFCGDSGAEAILIQTTDFPSLIINIKQVCSALNCQRSDIFKRDWKPYVILLLPVANYYNNSFSRLDFEQAIIQYYTFFCIESGNPLNIDSQLYVLIPESNNQLNETIYSYFELYSIQNKTIWREIFTRKGKHLFQPTSRKMARRRDFMGSKIRAIAQLETEYFATVKVDVVDGEQVFDKGYDTDYFNLMATSLNFTPVVVRGKGWIISDGNDSLTGMGKQLIDGEGDISINPSEYMSYRFKKVAFLQPYLNTRLTAFFQQPIASSMRDIYLETIPVNLRLAIAVTWILIISVLVGISLIERRILKHDFVVYPEHSTTHVINWIIAAACQKGSHVQPRNIPMRIGLLVSLSFSILVYIGFSASVVSQLSIPFIPIKTFDDILKSEMKLATDQYTQNAYELLEMTQREKKIDSRRIITGLSIDQNVAVVKICEDNVVYISLADEFYMAQRALNYTNKDLCANVSSINVNPIGKPVLAGMLVPKDSPYIDVFNYKQIQIRETGLLKRLFDAYVLMNVPSCEYIRSKKEINHLGLNDTITAFIFLIVSFVISFSILIAERITYAAILNGAYG